MQTFLLECRPNPDYISKKVRIVDLMWTLRTFFVTLSEGIRAVLKLMTNPGGDNVKRPGVMIPIPQSGPPLQFQPE